MKPRRPLLPDAERARACEVLGVALGLDPQFEGYNFNDDTDPCVHFRRALAIREGSGITYSRDYEQSDLNASFLVLSTEDCTTRADWEQIKTDTLIGHKNSILLTCR